MEAMLNSPKAEGLRVKVPYHGKMVPGTITKVIPNTYIWVTFDKGVVGEWDEDYELYDYPYKQVVPDYNPDTMKALMKKWRESTGTSAGPLGPMKHVKSFLTGRSRRRKARKSKKTRKGKNGFKNTR